MTDASRDRPDAADAPNAAGAEAGWTRIPRQSGAALLLRRSERLEVMDPEGEQVADLVAFAVDDVDEWLSSGRTFDYKGGIYLTRGDVLYSNRSQPMLTLERDDVGRHDFLLTPCAPATFEKLYPPGTAENHPSCLHNLAAALAPHGVAVDRIPTTFNIFMNVLVGEGGDLTIGPPRSRPGDRLRLRAEMDLRIGLTACSAEGSNNGRLKPIDYRVLPADP